MEVADRGVTIDTLAIGLMENALEKADPAVVGGNACEIPHGPLARAERSGLGGRVSHLGGGSIRDRAGVPPERRHISRTGADAPGGRRLRRYGICVNAVAHGDIDTPMSRDNPPEVKAGLIRRTPARRQGTAEEVARVIVFLAGPAADFVTGQVLAVEGGCSSG